MDRDPIVMTNPLVLGKEDAGLSLKLVNDDSEAQLMFESKPSSTNTSFCEKIKYTLTKRPIFYGFCAFNIIFWPLIIFLVIIPAIIQSICNSTEIEIKSALITNPTNNNFDSTIVAEFGKAPPIPATVKINQITASWNGAGGGSLLTLSNTNTVSISTKPTALYGVAEVSSASAMSNFLESAISATSLQWTLQGEKAHFVCLFFLSM